MPENYEENVSENKELEEAISSIKVAEIDDSQGIVFFGTCHCSGNKELTV